MKNVILGTAGHIDHGKSSLVKALTGSDPDRLKEERDRGITIDLGFANLMLPDDIAVGIVDVPGHERLIKNMLAGAGGIDILLMTIAADEGIMPQSREHLAICDMLRIKNGIIVLTKSDLVDNEWLELVKEEVRAFVKGTFLQNADIIPVSSKTGSGLDALKDKIHRIAKDTAPKLINGIFRLPVDRIFTLKGFGTVVTGTVLSGTIGLDSPVEILPSGISTKVRGLQSHGKSYDSVYAGQRAGINLQGIEKELLKRGDVVVASGRLVPTTVLDAEIELLPGAPLVKSRSLMHFYSGTSETIARVILYDRDELKPGEKGFCQFRLKDTIVALSGDRFIVRRLSPLETTGGGQILDPHPSKRKKNQGIQDLAAISSGSIETKVETRILGAGLSSVTKPEIEGWISCDLPDIHNALSALEKKGSIISVQGMFFHKEVVELFKKTAKEQLDRFHKTNPLKPGMPKEDLRLRLKADQKTFNALASACAELVFDKDTLRLATFSPAVSSADEGLKKKVLDTLSKEEFQPSSRIEIAQKLSVSEKNITDLLKLLSKEGLLVRITDAVYLTKENYDIMIDRLRQHFSKKQEMTVAEFRDLLATSRKFAMPFLEYLDSNKITLRVGDARKFMLK
ncbi:MAG: selenocysteine-specific translation elongation factor [Dissulfurispiraceae bacterium]|jgi:selenocysteine-specific elongation factor|nr:selenocysteine-specific translation elongation factor [Dissulfurispiraceae bacterium]